MTNSIMILFVMTIGTTTFSKTVKIVKGNLLLSIIQSVIVLSIIMLGVIMLGVIMLGVIVTSVVASKL